MDSLGFNETGDSGATALANALKVNQNLKTLVQVLIKTNRTVNLTYITSVITNSRGSIQSSYGYI